MKRYTPFIIIFGIPLIIFLTIFISYTIGYEDASLENQKNYQAACIFNHICKNMMETNSDVEENYYDCLDNLDCYDSVIVTRKDMINKYNWKYYK